MARTTRGDLEQLATIINRSLGAAEGEYFVQWGYGRPRLYRAGGSVEVSPRLPSGQLADWMRAFVAGIGSRDIVAYNTAEDARIEDRIRAEYPELQRWTVSEGRTVSFDGAPTFEVHGLEDRRGLRYIPAELDTLTREIAAALSARGTDGSKVTR